MARDNSRGGVLITVLLWTIASSAAAKPMKEAPVGAQFQAFAVDRAEGARLATLFAGLEAFPVRLSALEKLAGRRLRGHFSAESKSAGFEHDGRGPIGPNVGGEPLDHRATDAPMLFELRSQYYPRYDDEGRFRSRPPRAEDDPLIDRIELSDRYARGAPPELPGLTRFDNLLYVDAGEFWRAKRIGAPGQKHQGFLVLSEKVANQRQPDERWRLKISVERGPYFDAAEVDAGLAPLLELIAARSVKRGHEDFGSFFTQWKEKYAKNADIGSYSFGLVSHNPRYFDVRYNDGPDFLRSEGRLASLYVDTYVNTDAASEARAPVPALFAALGMKRANVTEDIPSPPPFRDHPEGIVYYNRVVVTHGKWRASMAGFYPLKDGKVVTDLDLAVFMPRSITLTWHETAQ